MRASERLFLKLKKAKIGLKTEHLRASGLRNKYPVVGHHNYNIKNNFISFQLNTGN